MRIGELPLANSVSTSDYVPIERSGVTYRVKYEALRGPAGENGADGEDGTIENLDVTATTLTPGSSATANYSGNLLTLGIPRGNTGATGNGISSIQKTSTVGLVDTYTIYTTSGATYSFTVTNGGGSITVDGSLSTTSTNPVQNKVITTALNAKAESSAVYSKADVDAMIANVGGKADTVTVTFQSSAWTASSWSASAVTAGAPSGGSCYVATYSDNDILLYNRFIPEHAAGYTGAVYVTPITHGLRVETSVQPAGSNLLSGMLIDTDAYVENGVATKFYADALTQDFSTLIALPQDPASSDLLAIRSGNGTYKIDYNALAQAILNQTEDISLSSFVNTTSYINTELSWVKRRGNEIFGYIATTSMSRNALQGIATINEGYRPKSQCIVGSATNGGAFVPYWLHSDGRILNIIAVSNAITMFSFHYVLPDF